MRISSSSRLAFFTICCSATLAQKPVIDPSGVLNAASYVQSPNPAIAPQMLVSIFGQHLAASPVGAQDSPLPLELNGTSVKFNGIAAPLVYVSPSQINAQVPSALTSATTASIVVSSAAGVSEPISVLVSKESDGIFTQGSFGCGQASALNLHADGTSSVNTPQNSLDPQKDIGFALFLTGLGYFPDRLDGIPWKFNLGDNLIQNFGPVYAMLDTETFNRPVLLNMTYAGPAPGLVGVDQVNALFNPLFKTYSRQGCRVALALGDTRGTGAQYVNVSSHDGGGACSDVNNDSLGLITWEKNFVSAEQGSTASEDIAIQFLKADGGCVPDYLFRGVLRIW